MGIENIIKRMQDVEKLKIMLFDDNQRKLFDRTPKPGIRKSKTDFKPDFKFTSILRSKREFQKFDSDRFFNMSFDEHPIINQKRTEIVEESVSKKFQQKKNSGL